MTSFVLSREIIGSIEKIYSKVVALPIYGAMQAEKNSIR